MNVLVTGGAGFIGSNLVGALIEEGHQVTVLDNLSTGFKSNLIRWPQVASLIGDIRDAKAVSRVMGGQDIVFHLAASVGNPRSIDDPIVDAEINVLGTLNLLKVMRRAGVRKIVASSSAGIFGEPRILPMKEDHPVDPLTPYGCSKLCMEKECLAFSNLFDMEAICLRYFNVYGPNQRYDEYGNVVPKFVFRALKKEILSVNGDGEQSRDFVYVTDVVQANLKAAEVVGISGAFNIGSGISTTVNELVALIRGVVGMNLAVEGAPERTGDPKHSLADISAARRVLGYDPSVDIRTGLREYIQWAAKEMAHEAK